MPLHYFSFFCSSSPTSGTWPVTTSLQRTVRARQEPIRFWPSLLSCSRYFGNRTWLMLDSVSRELSWRRVWRFLLNRKPPKKISCVVTIQTCGWRITCNFCTFACSGTFPHSSKNAAIFQDNAKQKKLCISFAAKSIYPVCKKQAKFTFPYSPIPSPCSFGRNAILWYSHPFFA